MNQEEKPAISFFEKNLTYWVVLCMGLGILIGKFVPAIPSYLARFEYANVSIPIALLIWMMIYPMMLKVDFASIKNVGRNPAGLFVTWIVNWCIKPFTMFAIAGFFFYYVFKPWIPHDLAKDYLAGAILLGAAPCTAMVFVWSHLTRGNAAYTVVQVATNDLLILIAFTPIVAFLLGVSGVSIPWDTLLVSVILFVVIPLAAGIVTRSVVVHRKGIDYFNQKFLPTFNPFTIVGLLLTLVLIFSFQGDVILNNPLHILLIAVPLVTQTFLIFFLAYFACQRLRCRHDVAAPAGMIGASNFFELSVAVAITLFGASSPVVLATIVGVLVEVPVMLVLVKIANGTTGWFSASRIPLYSDLEEYLKLRAEEFPLIPEERKLELEQVARYVHDCISNSRPSQLTFICTHNSRRSQLSQVWAQVAAAYYGINEVATYSGGTEATAFNPRAVAALKRAGLSIASSDTNAPNPHYEVRSSQGVVPQICFSKVYDEPPNPTSHFCAIMTCSHADEACPVVAGCDLRIPIRYEDPKIADDTPQESLRYDERSQQICREMLFLMSRV